MLTGSRDGETKHERSFIIVFVMEIADGLSEQRSCEREEFT